MDTTPGFEPDWLFEREWRVPVGAENPLIQGTADNLVGILIGDPDWEPSRLVETGDCRNASNGERAYPGGRDAQRRAGPRLSNCLTRVRGGVPTGHRKHGGGAPRSRDRAG
jgi:hypothetical protein